MHFEILTEDKSGKELLDIIIPKIISPKNTFRIIDFKGIGKIPNNIHKEPDPKKKLILNKLPALLRAYGKMYNEENCTVIVVIDCDKRNCSSFKQELTEVLKECNPKPNVFFRIAIEEIEAWLLGDITAMERAYPKLDKQEYKEYIQDSIIGTWEKLADITLSRNIARNLKNQHTLK